jgi:hypothetical protein
MYRGLYPDPAPDPQPSTYALRLKRVLGIGFV